MTDQDFHWLNDWLAVGGAAAVSDPVRLADTHSIGGIVDLRREDRDDEDALRAAGISLLHLPTPDLHPPSHAHLERGVEFVGRHRARGQKVLIHCQHGIGRSALLALCVLVDQGFEPIDALRHAKDRRAVISPSRAQYDGWCSWLESRGLEPPDYHSFGCIAYSHLAKG